MKSTQYRDTVCLHNAMSSSNSDCVNMHACPVWQLRWVDHDTGQAGEDKVEMLVSVSGDGRISKWIHYKGLECVGMFKKVHLIAFFFPILQSNTKQEHKNTFTFHILVIFVLRSNCVYLSSVRFCRHNPVILIEICVIGSFAKGQKSSHADVTTP